MPGVRRNLRLSLKIMEKERGTDMFILEADKVGLTLRQTETLTSGARNIYRCAFVFSRDWEGLDKTAVFTTDTQSVETVLDGNGECQIPWEVLAEPERMLWVSIFGTTAEDVVMPSVMTQLGRVQPGSPRGEESEEPPTDVYAQILAVANSALETAQSVREDADAGVLDGAQGPQGEQGEKGDKGDMGAQGPQGEPGADAPQIWDDAPLQTNPYSGAKVSAEADVTRGMIDGVYAGVDLTEKFAEEIAGYSDAWAWIQARIQAANYAGIHIGDYIPFTTTDGRQYHAQVAGIDTYYQCGDTPIGRHIDFICKELWAAVRRRAQIAAWNNGTTVSPYPWLASELYLYVNSLSGSVPSSADATPEMTEVDYTADGIYYYLPEELKAVIIEKQALLEKRYTEGKILTTPNGMAWVDAGKLWVPSEPEVFGMNIGCNPMYGSGGGRQYPLFRNAGTVVRFRHDYPTSREYWWLMSMRTGDGGGWCTVQHQGQADGANPTLDNRAVPVCFRVG